MAYLFVISHLIIKGAHYNNNKILKPSPTMQQKTTVYIVIHVASAHSRVSLQCCLRDSKKSKGLTLFIEQTKHEYACVANYVAIFTINM